MTYSTVRVVQFVNVLLFALVMGVFWGTWFSLSQSIASIRPGTFLEVGHTMIRNLKAPMSVLMPAALVSSVLVLLMLFRQRRSSAFNLALAGLALLGALVITMAVHVPIDDQINLWTPMTLPADRTTTRDRWELYHTVRTFASIGALGFAVASALRWSPSSIGRA